MSSNRTQRRPISIDNDEIIDFSAVTKASTTKLGVPLVLLQSTVTETAQRQQDTPHTLTAVDPRLNAYVHRAAPRRRIGFGGTSTVTPVSFTNLLKKEPGVDNHTTNGGHNVSNSTTKDLLDAFWREDEDAAQQGVESHHKRCEAYEQQVQAIWQGDLDAPNVSGDAKHKNNTMPRQSYSLFDQFFADGVPDVEPWDLWALSIPRYGGSNLAVGLPDRVHHPVLQETHYSRHYLHRSEDRPVVVKLAKTREELRAERRERLRKAKEERDRVKRAAQREQQNKLHSGDAVGIMTGSVEKDRLTNSNLRFNLFGDSVLNPLSTENKIFSQYQERFLEHQRRNHDRHVAAIPNQIEKRKRELKRHAEERPLFRAYRIYPIYTPSHLGKLRNFANDGLLRGFFLWVCHCDALVVLTGGEVAMRHLDRWILEKMKWESPETVAVRLMTCPLQDASTFSFVSAKSRRRERHPSQAEEAAKINGDKKNMNRDDGGEHVYMNFVDSVQEGENFMRSVPTEGPWQDLMHVWRAALGCSIEKNKKKLY